MCQLAAYIGDRPIAPLLLNALEYQEPYFGSHATGIGVLNKDRIALEKGPGYVAHVKKTTKITKLTGTCAIAHSRYSTDVKVDSRYNTVGMAHPFLSEDGKIALMHNGVFSNYREHWAKLKSSHKFTSYNNEVDAITDSEVAIHDLSEAVAKGNTIPEALKWMASKYTGSFLLAVISLDEPDTVYIANWHQPCYLAIADDEVMFVSSKMGLNDLKDAMSSIFQPPKNSLIKLTWGKVEITKLDSARKVPDLNLDMNILGGLFTDVLRKKGRKDFREMWDELNPDGWAKSYGLTNREWGELRINGISIVNPFIDVVEMLKHDKIIIESIDRRLEGGVKGTPRFSYILS